MIVASEVTRLRSPSATPRSYLADARVNGRRSFDATAGPLTSDHIAHADNLARTVAAGGLLCEREFAVVSGVRSPPRYCEVIWSRLAQRSSGRRPVRFAIRASMRGPTSSSS